MTAFVNIQLLIKRVCTRDLKVLNVDIDAFEETASDGFAWRQI